MLRLTEVRLPLDHAEGEIQAAILRRLDVGADELLRYTVIRRAVDARKRSSIALNYTLDAEVRNGASLLARLAGDRRVTPPPGTTYPFAPPGPGTLAPAAGRKRRRAGL